MRIKRLTEEQLPEALSIARGVFDYCLRQQITDLEMVHIFLQYSEPEHVKKMMEEGKLILWGAYEQGNMVAMSGMQNEGHITMLYVLPVYQKRGWGKKLLEEMRTYAYSEYNLSRVTLSAMPAWTADYFTKQHFMPIPTSQPCSFVPMEAPSIDRLNYESKQLPTAAVLGISLGGLAVCIAAAVIDMIAGFHGMG